MKLSQRAAYYLDFAHNMRALEFDEAGDDQRLSHLQDLLRRFVARPDYFPAYGFPLMPGTPGGLFRLVEFPDHRATIYMSLGVTGRSQPPHRHRAWALVGGVAGGIETNQVYSFLPGQSEGTARLELNRTVNVGPGDVAAVEEGEFHTIEVVSETPVFHIHAYAHSVDDPHYFAPAFASAKSSSYELRANAGFDPPFARATAEEIKKDLEDGSAILLSIGQPIPGTLAGAPHILAADVKEAIEQLSPARFSAHLPVIVTGAPPNAQMVAREAVKAGRPLMFILD